MNSLVIAKICVPKLVTDANLHVTNCSATNLMMMMTNDDDDDNDDERKMTMMMTRMRARVRAKASEDDHL